MNPWHDLLSNLALVAIATAVWTFGSRHIADRAPWFRSLAFGGVMACGAVACMWLPFQFREGIFLDARYTFLAVSGFFGGPVAAVVPFISTLFTRVLFGGAGLSVAIPHILTATAFGLFFWWRIRGRKHTSRSLTGLAIMVALSGTWGFYFWLPASMWMAVTMDTTLPFALVLAASTLLAGVAIIQETRRHDATMENRMYRSIIEALPDCLNAKDLDGRFIAANPATAEMMGATNVASIIGRADSDFYPTATADEFRIPEQEVLRSRQSLRLEQKFVSADGRDAWLGTLKAPLFDGHGGLVGVITHNREITQQKVLEKELETARKRLTDAMDSMADGLAMFDRDGLLVLHNERYVEMFPVTADVRQPGVSHHEIVQASFARGEEHPVKGCSDSVIERTAFALARPGDRVLQLADGRWIDARTRETGEGGFLIVYSDVTRHREREARLQELNERLTDLANTDGLTELSNRRAFDAALEMATRSARAAGADLGLLMIDVDRFKAYNDSYGHQAGDACLRKVTGCIREALEAVAGSVVARYGGEEFAVIIPNANGEEILGIGRMLNAAVRSLGIEHVGSEKRIVTVSVGASSLKYICGERKEDLVRSADEGLYSAKAAGRDCVRQGNTMEAAGQGSRQKA